MAKHKVSELDGALLDAAVAKAMPANPDTLPFTPSTSWEHGGPIIERERITLVSHGIPGLSRCAWQAAMPGTSKNRHGIQSGELPLIAAMRAYVASKFGEEIELP